MNDVKKDGGSSGVHKLLTVIGIILCVILIPILAINCTLLIKGVSSDGGVPSIGGKFPMIILTDSMSGVFEAGDLIVCETAEPEEIKDGDIICFFDPEGSGTSTVTHRVIEVTKDENGGLAWKTKGDANNTEDKTLVSADKLLGVYKTKFSGLGNAAIFIQTTKGLVICVMLPIILLVAIDVLRRRKYDKSKQKDTEALMAELAELKAAKAAETEGGAEEKASGEETETGDEENKTEIKAGAEE